MKTLKMLLKVVLVIIIIVVLYVGGNILYAYLTNFSPDEKVAITIDHPVETKVADGTLTIMSWNIGYAGLGDQENFFYDGGTMVRPTKERVEANLNGIVSFLRRNSEEVDFFLIQEVDTQSKRSYRINEYEVIGNSLPGYCRSYAMNFLVDYVPMPLEKPWNVMGKVTAGLATYSKYQPVDVVRYQLPGAFPFPKNLYMLDRCLLVQRHTLSNGKELLVINLHNSAYDDTGKLKAQEMAYLKDLITREYEKGNYVIVGGDWNQNPPGFDNNTFSKNLKETYPQTAVMADFMPADWQWAFDPTSPTNRNLITAYDKDKTFTTVIDYFLISPNVELVSVKGSHLGFRHSDHQPVTIKVKLKQPAVDSTQTTAEVDSTM